ncbi:ABC transporter ATP-binding protein [Xanthobacteraceae bacterium Astr-EGSB]|uniref:ABC transporter ATP-binding protein n=1 Tax=Astrobacterium formosum TaxID=3069710 RepID=UPI0027B4B971|nr:ABC transporter ATP-binding protein [Xanthobacteraceae bacterium Astr-EGSB]
METTGARVRVEACGKTFPDGTHALEPISFEIARGETVAMLGPSGCGKTTALRIIAGLMGPDAGGSVWFDDEDVTSLPIERRHVGMVFQSYALFPNMTVEGNVAYGLKIRKVPKAERAARVGEVLDMMHIAELADRAIDQLSGGQRQRVALARALAVRPRLLLLDEPLTALDASLRERLRTEIDALLRSLGITAVYVTHDQSEALVLGDRVIVMEKGRIAQIGTARDIYLKPQSRFVAEFIGTMNRIEGSIRTGRFESAVGGLAVERADANSAAAFFRPESVRLERPESAPFRLTVERVHFLGASQRLHLRGADAGRPIIVDTDNRASYAPGALVGIAVAAEDLLFL